jgi:hypothetical protein
MSGVLEAMGGEVRSVMGVEEEMDEVVGVDIVLGVVGCDGEGCDGDCDGREGFVVVGGCERMMLLVADERDIEGVRVSSIYTTSAARNATLGA